MRQQRVAEDRTEMDRAVRRLGGVLGGDRGLERRLLAGRHPGGVARPVGEVEVGPHADERGGQALDQEHQLPAGQPEGAVHVEEEARDRPAEDEAERLAQVEQAEDLGPLLRREPVGQVEQHAGEEAGLGDAEQHPQQRERGVALHEGHGGGEQAPGHHDARQPDPRPDPVQDQVARQLEHRVADEEDARREGEGRLRDPGRELERLLGVCHVGAVEIGQQVHQHQERHQAPPGGGDGGFGVRRR